MVDRIELFRMYFHSGFFLLLTLSSVYLKLAILFRKYNKILLFSVYIFADSLTVLRKTADSQRLSSLYTQQYFHHSKIDLSITSSMKIFWNLLQYSTKSLSYQASIIFCIHLHQYSLFFAYKTVSFHGLEDPRGEEPLEQLPPLYWLDKQK